MYKCFETRPGEEKPGGDENDEKPSLPCLSFPTKWKFWVNLKKHRVPALWLDCEKGGCLIVYIDSTQHTQEWSSRPLCTGVCEPGHTASGYPLSRHRPFGTAPKRELSLPCAILQAGDLSSFTSPQHFWFVVSKHPLGSLTTQFPSHRPLIRKLQCGFVYTAGPIHPNSFKSQGPSTGSRAGVLPLSHSFPHSREREVPLGRLHFPPHCNPLNWMQRAAFPQQRTLLVILISSVAWRAKCRNAHSSSTLSCFSQKSPLPCSGCWVQWLWPLAALGSFLPLLPAKALTISACWAACHKNLNLSRFGEKDSDAGSNVIKHSFPPVTQEFNHTILLVFGKGGYKRGEHLGWDCVPRHRLPLWRAKGMPSPQLPKGKNGNKESSALEKQLAIGLWFWQCSSPFYYSPQDHSSGPPIQSRHSCSLGSWARRLPMSSDRQQGTKV